MTIKYDLIQQFHEKNIYYKFQVPICEKMLVRLIYVFFSHHAIYQSQTYKRGWWSFNFLVIYEGTYVI